MFGIVDEEKTRIFREIFIVIGRKNGKSLFASAIIAYMAFLEPEYGQEIYCLAPKLDQAALVYDGFYKMVQAEEELEELTKKMLFGKLNAAVSIRLKRVFQST